MSDFDKEAEREKLREKYERDVAKREATQRMSDLLLKGATMTNTHCSTCGDPLFQQDGTTFCPSCHGNPDAVEGTDLDAQPAEESTGDSGRQHPSGNEAGATPDRTENGAPDRQSGGTADRSPAPESDRTAPRGASERGVPDDTAESTAATESGHGGEADPATTNDTSRSARTRSGESTPPRRSTRNGRDAKLDDAHDSLVAALEKFAAEAADTDDPRYAKACLEAAREASETIDGLR